MLIKPDVQRFAKIKVVGLGGGGCNALSSMISFQQIQGVEFIAINTDAHSAETLWYMKLAVGQARKGWCKKSDIVNTLTFKELKKII